jgi:nitrite reductase/ring-hydroxylating ferredoxin subunit/DMSO/TMAO reductase YedYZ heme-binding membrane subunit
VSNAYRAVQWNRNKVVYDAVAVGATLLFVAVFFAVSVASFAGDRAISPPIVLMRALGVAGLLLLHLVLAIGPLARLDRRFLPLLYNRRHLGVLTFCVGFLHAFVAVGFYHGFGEIAAPLSVLVSNARAGSVSAFPFEWLGVAGLAVLFLLAATSHDFWLHQLSPRIWKYIHLSIYPAYATLVLHVALGAMQSEPSPVIPAALAAGVVTLAALHLAAGWRGRGRPHLPATADTDVDDAWIDVGPVDGLRDGHGTVVAVRGKPAIAVFRAGERFYAISNVCAHQGGPLGEGRFVDGCVTCPWHGYQYRPQDGCAPPPFTDRLPTYAVRWAEGRLQVSAKPLPVESPATPLPAGE